MKGTKVAVRNYKQPFFTYSVQIETSMNAYIHTYIHTYADIYMTETWKPASKVLSMRIRTMQDDPEVKS